MTSVAAPHEHLLPPTPERALKRSASTASLLSPPASVRKPRAIKRLRSALDPEDEHVPTAVAQQRPRTRAAKGKKKVVARTSTVIPSVEPPVKRARLADPTETNDENVPTRPCTPPPCSLAPAPSIAPQTPPRTVPKRGGRFARDAPLRDSPNNPFLVERSGSPVPLRPRPVRRAADFQEGPTVAYVFRGVPTTFANPYANQCPPSPTLEPNHPSFLPIDHPDFSPCEITRPQLLFPEAHGYARSGGSPCAQMAPSTPKRGPSKPPTTPVRSSKRQVETGTPGPIQVASTEPKTPEPRTPPRRIKTRSTVLANAEGEVRMMKTRSKTAAATNN